MTKFLKSKHKVSFLCGIWFSIIMPLCFFSCNRFSTLAVSTKGGKHLSYNKKNLSAIPAEVYNTDYVSSLSLFGNHFTSVEDSISKLKDLEILYLGKNDLVSFPKSVCNLPNLRILSLANNDIDSIPDCICKLKNLEVLYLNNNNLVYISDSIGQLKRLNVLNVDRNNLRTLGKGVYELDSLQLLNISNNFIDSISASVQHLHALKELRMVRSGMLTPLPEELCRLRMLELLVVDQFTVLPTCVFTKITNRLRIQIEEF